MGEPARHPPLPPARTPPPPGVTGRSLVSGLCQVVRALVDNLAHYSSRGDPPGCRQRTVQMPERSFLTADWHGRTGLQSSPVRAAGAAGARPGAGAGRAAAADLAAGLGVYSGRAIPGRWRAAGGLCRAGAGDGQAGRPGGIARRSGGLPGCCGALRIWPGSGRS